MRKRKIFLALVLTLCVAAVLSVCAFAFDIYTDLPSGVTNESEKWIGSGYTDVDTEDGWYLMSGSGDYSTTDESFPTFASLSGSRFYWHKETNRAVWIATGTELSGNSGEQNVVSLANVDKPSSQKFYGFACAFVDLTNTENNLFMTGFAESDADIGKYIQLSATTYPIWDRYVTAGTAKKLWENVNVSKAAYTGFVAYKEELGYAEDAKVTEQAHQDLLVEYAYKNIATYKALKNCKENGASFTMAWIFSQLANANMPFESVEFRGSASSITFRTIGLVTQVMEVKTVLFDKKFNKLQFTDITRGLFYGNESLNTLAHVTFDMDGNYNPDDVVEGVVDLTGFTVVIPYSTYYVSQILQNAGMTNAVWFSSISDETSDYAGIIDTQAFMGAGKLAELTIPATVTLKQIKKEAFSGCTSLKTINILGAVASDMEIVNKNAFTGVSGLTINVNSNKNKIYMENALAQAGVTGVTVVNVAPPSELDKAIVADGYSIRQNDENAKTKGPALRAEFTLKASVVDNAEQTLVDFGVIVVSADTFENIYDRDIYAVYDIAVAGTDTRVIRKSAKNGPYVAVHDNRDITFAAAITKIPEDNYQSAIYTYAYAVWSDGTVGYTTYTSERTGKTAHSLYDMTIFALRNGLINSENTDSDKLWPVLEKGALAYEGNIGTSQAADPQNYTNATLYLNNPLYAYSNFVGHDQSATGVTLEATSSTNVMWSIYADGDEYIVVYRNAGGEGEALLPGVYKEDKSASHPFNPKYIREDAHTPALSEDAYEKIKTLVIDYGIDGVMINGDGALASMSYVETIVYPNGFDEIDHYKRDWGADKNDNDGDGNTTEYVVDVDGDGSLYDGSENYVVKFLFSYNKALKDIIWANHDQYAHMQDFNIADGDAAMKHLFDLRGMKEWPANQNIFTGTPCVQNVVFGAGSKRPIYDNVFRDATALERAWHETSTSIGEMYDAPLAKTIDFGVKVGWGNLQNSPFGIKSNGYVVILYSGNASYPSYVEKTFFDVRQDVSTLTVRVKIVDANGAPADPTNFMAKINSAIADRVFVYQITGDNAGKYINASGTVYSE